jgi:hypothetical protein
VTGADAAAAGGSRMTEPAPPGNRHGRPRPELRGRRGSDRALARRLGLAFDGATRVSVGISLAGAGAFAGLAYVVGAPYPAVVVSACALVYLGTIWLPLIVVGRSNRQLHFVAAVARIGAAKDWSASFPTSPEPSNDAEASAWLATHPEPSISTPALALEGSLLLGLGRVAEARERIERMEVELPFYAFERAMMLAEIDFESGGDGDLATARELAMSIPGERAKVAAAELGLENATRAIVAGEPWGPAIAEAYRLAGTPAWREIVTMAIIHRGRYYQRWILAGVFVMALVTATFLGPR